MLSCVGSRGVLAFANNHFEDQEWKGLLTLLGNLALHLARGNGMRLCGLLAQFTVVHA